MTPARIIMLIMQTVTNLLVSALKSLNNYFYGAILTNALQRKKHII